MKHKCRYVTTYTDNTTGKERQQTSMAVFVCCGILGVLLHHTLEVLLNAAVWQLIIHIPESNLALIRLIAAKPGRSLYLWIPVTLWQLVLQIVGGID